MAGGALFSRILAFGRDAALAWLLGNSWIADCFLAAFRVPNFFRRLFAEGAVALAFVPVFTRQGARSMSFSRCALFSLTAIFTALALAAFFFAKPLYIALAPGFVSKPESLSLGAELLKLCLWYLPLAAAAAVLSGIWLGLGEYRRPAVSSACFNIGMLGVIFVLYCMGVSGGGPGSELFTVRWLALGVLLGGASQLISQIPGLYGKGFRFFGRLAPFSEGCRNFLRRAPSIFVGSGGQQLAVLAATLLASFLAEGSVAALYFAERLFELPLGLVGVAVGLAALPDLSVSGAELAGSRKEAPEESAKLLADFNRTLGEGLALAWVFSLPAAVGLAVLAAPVVELLFGHGAFGPQAVEITGRVLTVYALGLPAASLCRPLLSALSALNGERLGMYATLGGLFCTVVAGAWLSSLYGVEGVAWGVVCGTWLNMLLLGFFMSSALRRFGGKFAPLAFPRAFLFASLLSMVMGLGLYLALPRLASFSLFFRLALLIPAAGGLYLAGCLILLRLGILRLKGSITTP